MGSSDVTLLLRAWGDGDPSAAEELFPVIYEQLKNLARLRAVSTETPSLHPTALVHEAFIAMSNDARADWRDRAQFFAFAAVVMRRIMLQSARARKADKRGGEYAWVQFDELYHSPISVTVDFELLDAALTRLEQLDPTQARIVELRFFGGLAVEETAEILNISPRTVNRQWAFAKAWLAQQVASAEKR